MQRWPAQPDIEATTLVDVISGHDDEVVLRAAEGEDALEIRGGALVDDFGDVRGADEADRVDAGMVADRLDDLLAAMHDVEDAVGQTGFAQQFGDAAGAERHLLGRLEDHGVAEGDGVGDRPVGNHVREVERRDGSHDADRVTLDAALDAAADFEHFAGDDLRQRSGELAQLRGFQDLGRAFIEDLPVLLGDQRRELLHVFLEQRFVAIENLHAFFDRNRCPRRLRLARGIDGAIDFCLPGHRHARDHLTRRRVGDIHRLPPLGINECAPNVVADSRVLGARGLVDGGHGVNLSQTRRLEIRDWHDVRVPPTSGSANLQSLISNLDTAR